MGRFLVLSMVMTFTTIVTAQSNRISIKGEIQDTLGEPLIESTILLLDPSDSTLITYSRADANGKFEFKNLRPRDYLVKVSFIGFVNHFRLIRNPQGDIDIGLIKLQEISKELFEVVVREARAPMSIRGDTIEYDASTFKVPPGSTVEELLRRLPGMEVDVDGSIKSEGQDVTRVTVDGKQFFGSDPKTATKNLPAEGISKVQVFREVTEEEKITGNKRMDGNKTMNLELKEEFKSGGFGKVIAGVGTEDRFEIKGNYNKFDDKQQFSLVGVGNNTGRNGLGWNDYQDFRGNQSFNFDDGFFGFGGGGGGRRMVIRMGSDLGIGNSFFGDSGAGFPRVGSGGINYNYNDVDRKLSGLYFYDYKGLRADAVRTQEFFLPERSFTNRDLSSTRTGNQSHSAELSYEEKLDSLTTLVVKATGVASSSDVRSGADLTLRRNDGSLSNLSSISSDISSDNYTMRVNAIVRRKFMKQGRSMGLSASYGYVNNSARANQLANNTYFDEDENIESVLMQDQVIQSTGLEHEIRFNTIYVEPLTRKIYWETFYNYSNRSSVAERLLSDVFEDQLVANDSLTRFTDNRTVFNRLGSSLRYTFESWNIQAGASAQQYRLLGSFRSGEGFGFAGEVDNTFNAVSPYFSADYSFQRNKSAGFNYIMDNSVPTFEQLQPIIDNSNPLFIREGNPDLLPTFDHDFSLRFRSFNPLKFTSFFGNLSYTYTDSPIIYEQLVDEQNVTTSRPINYKHRHSIGSHISFGFPIVKNKLTVNTHYNASYSRAFTLVNNVDNATTTLGNRGGVRVNFTPFESMSFFMGSNLGVTDVTYSLHSSQNQRIVNQNYSATLNARLFWGIYFNSDFNYRVYRNERFGFDTKIPILNLSVYKVFLKDNRGELRLSGFDIFDRNQAISQSADANMVREVATSTLAQYFMLSFTYNMRGIQTETNTRRGWF